jgi:hypothetical protein
MSEQILRSKKITINSNAYLLPLGGVLGPISNTYRETIETIGQLIRDGYIVEEYTPDGQKILLNKDNYKKPLGGTYTTADEDLEEYARLDALAKKAANRGQSSEAGSGIRPGGSVMPPPPHSGTSSVGSRLDSSIPSQPRRDQLGDLREEFGTSEATTTHSVRLARSSEVDEPMPSLTEEPAAYIEPLVEPVETNYQTGTYTNSDWSYMYNLETRNARMFKPNTHYNVGDGVAVQVNPKTVQVFICNTEHTSGSVFEPSKWNKPTTATDAKLLWIKPTKPPMIPYEEYDPTKEYHSRDTVVKFNDLEGVWDVFTVRDGYTPTVGSLEVSRNADGWRQGTNFTHDGYDHL